MTTNQAKPGPDGPAMRLGMWLGHYAYLLLIVQVGFSAAAHLLVAAAPGGWWPAVLAVVSTLLTLLAAAALLLQGLHDRRLCLRDINEAPLLDPDRAVRSRMRELRVHHAPGLQVIILLAALLAVFAGSFVKHAPAWLNLLYVAGLLVVGYSAFVNLTHRRLEPWCPFCDHRGDGGDDGDIPEPSDPDPGRRSVPA